MPTGHSTIPAEFIQSFSWLGIGIASSLARVGIICTSTIPAVTIPSQGRRWCVLSWSAAYVRRQRWWERARVGFKGQTISDQLLQ